MELYAKCNVTHQSRVLGRDSRQVLEYSLSRVTDVVGYCKGSGRWGLAPGRVCPSLWADRTYHASSSLQLAKGSVQDLAQSAEGNIIILIHPG